MDNGDGTTSILLPEGLTAIIDTDFIETARPYKWRGCLQYGHYYVTAAAKPKPVMLHRLVLGAPPRQIVDHINGDTLDNRRNNLRFATGEESCFNRGKYRTKTSTEFKGVFLIAHGKTKPWIARCGKDRKQHFLGCFATPEEAARAYDEKARELHGEFARLNFPDEREQAA